MKLLQFLEKADSFHSIGLTKLELNALWYQEDLAAWSIVDVWGLGVTLTGSNLIILREETNYKLPGSYIY